MKRRSSGLEVLRAGRAICPSASVSEIAFLLTQAGLSALLYTAYDLRQAPGVFRPLVQAHHISKLILLPPAIGSLMASPQAPPI
jgi:hypothetical protein